MPICGSRGPVGHLEQGHTRRVTSSQSPADLFANCRLGMAVAVPSVLSLRMDRAFFVCPVSSLILWKRRRPFVVHIVHPVSAMLPTRIMVERTS